MAVISGYIELLMNRFPNKNVLMLKSSLKFCTTGNDNNDKCFFK